MTYDQLTSRITDLSDADKLQLFQMLAQDVPSSEAKDVADTLGRRAYYDGVVRDLAEDFVTRARAKEFKDREAIIEAIHESVDGHHDVIYTSCAQDVVRYSDNSGAYVDNFGSEGLTRGGEIQWSAMAYAALEADLYDYLRAEGLDVNDEPDEWFDGALADVEVVS